MPTDDEIRELCSRLLSAKGLDFESVIHELQSAIHGRFEKLSNLAMASILRMPSPRKSSEEEEQGDRDEMHRYGT